MADKTLPPRLKPNVRWDTPEAVGQVSWALRFGTALGSMPIHPEAHDEDGGVVATQAKFSEELFSSKECRKRETWIFRNWMFLNL